MKITIIGAGGRTGILTVYQALDKGYEVKALSRKAANVPIRHPKIEIIEGDVMVYDRVKEAVEGADGVIITLGMKNEARLRTLSEGTRQVITAMKENGVNRLIVMSSAGILGNDTHTVFGKLMIPLLFRHVFRDKKRQLEIIRESGLEWVVVRPPQLTDAPKTGKYQITQGKPGSKSIPRADVADFMLKLLKDKTHDHTLPSIASF